MEEALAKANKAGRGRSSSVPSISLPFFTKPATDGAANSKGGVKDGKPDNASDKKEAKTTGGATSKAAILKELATISSRVELLARALQDEPESQGLGDPFSEAIDDLPTAPAQVNVSQPAASWYGQALAATDNGGTVPNTNPQSGLHQGRLVNALVTSRSSVAATSTTSVSLPTTIALDVVNYIVGGYLLIDFVKRREKDFAKHAYEELLVLAESIHRFLELGLSASSPHLQRLATRFFVVRKGGKRFGGNWRFASAIQVDPDEPFTHLTEEKAVKTVADYVKVHDREARVARASAKSQLQPRQQFQQRQFQQRQFTRGPDRFFSGTPRQFDTGRQQEPRQQQHQQQPQQRRQAGAPGQTGLTRDV